MWSLDMTISEDMRLMDAFSVRSLEEVETVSRIPEFFIDNKEVVLAENENHNNLHSGPDGFEKKLWEVKEISQEKNSVDFFRISPDGENGFPGEFSIVVKYEFTEENELKTFLQRTL